MTSFDIIIESRYFSFGRLEAFLDRCSYQPSRGDKRFEVSAMPGKLEITLYTWHLCICHPKL